MTFRHLEIFLKTAETLSMSRAAKELFISQPTVSQAVSELERDAGVPLFERLGRKLYLTAAGSQFVEYAAHIVALAAEAERRLSGSGIRNAIRIGGSMTVGTTILPGLAAGLVKRLPGCHIYTVVDNTARLSEMILRNDIDIALAEGEMKSGGIVSEPVMSDELLLVCGQAHRFSELTSVESTMLNGERFIVREKGSGTRELFEDMMKLHAIEWYEAGVMNNIESIKLAVAEGLGLSVLPAISIGNEADRGRLFAVRIEGISFTRSFSLFYHRNKLLTDIMREFIGLCRDCANERKNCMDINRFDIAAARWDSKPGRMELASAVAGGMESMLGGRRGGRALEYGCGTGLISFLLRESFDSLVLADSSAGMIKEAREKIAAAGVSNMTALVLDLTVDAAPAETYDVIYSSMAFHHISDVPSVLEKLFTATAPGGVLLIADLDEEDGSFHEDEAVFHNGFNRDELALMAERAGYSRADERTVHTMDRTRQGRQRSYDVFVMKFVKG